MLCNSASSLRQLGLAPAAMEADVTETDCSYSSVMTFCGLANETNNQTKTHLDSFLPSLVYLSRCGLEVVAQQATVTILRQP